ncbi:hypothetical protein HDU76_010273, partial [Blyttiomyces sp. JEL0837]
PPPPQPADTTTANSNPLPPTPTTPQDDPKHTDPSNVNPTGGTEQDPSTEIVIETSVIVISQISTPDNGDQQITQTLPPAVITSTTTIEPTQSRGHRTLHVSNVHGNGTNSNPFNNIGGNGGNSTGNGNNNNSTSTAANANSATAVMTSPVLYAVLGIVALGGALSLLWCFKSFVKMDTEGPSKKGARRLKRLAKHGVRSSTLSVGLGAFGEATSVVGSSGNGGGGIVDSLGRNASFSSSRGHGHEHCVANGECIHGIDMQGLPVAGAVGVGSLSLARLNNMGYSGNGGCVSAGGPRGSYGSDEWSPRESMDRGGGRPPSISSLSRHRLSAIAHGSPLGVTVVTSECSSTLCSPGGSGLGGRASCDGGVGGKYKDGSSCYLDVPVVSVTTMCNASGSYRQDVYPNEPTPIVLDSCAVAAEVCLDGTSPTTLTATVSPSRRKSSSPQTQGFLPTVPEDIEISFYTLPDRLMGNGVHSPLNQKSICGVGSPLNSPVISSTLNRQLGGGSLPRKHLSADLHRTYSDSRLDLANETGAVRTQRPVSMSSSIPNRSKSAPNTPYLTGSSERGTVERQRRAAFEQHIQR